MPTILELNRKKNTDPKAFTGKKFLLWMGCFLGVMFVVNGIFVYQALHSFSGLETQSAYKDGLKYDETIKAAHAQKALGWQGDFRLEGEADKTLRFSLTDQAGQPLRGLNVSAVFKRSANYHDDMQLKLVEAAPGVYQAVAGNMAKGRWRLELSALNTQGISFRSQNTLMVE